MIPSGFSRAFSKSSNCCSSGFRSTGIRITVRVLTASYADYGLKVDVFGVLRVLCCMSKAQWQIRILGYGLEDPEQLLANDKNFRIHPAAQQKAMSALLRTVGIVQNIIVNQRTQKVIDGHMRIQLAISEG